MNYPKTIIFDYGHTLLYESDWNTDRGNEALLKYAVKNPNNCTVEDITKSAELIFGEHVAKVRKQGYDISGQIANRTLYDYLGIEFSLSPVEMETVFWDNASSGEIMPGADKMLDYLNENGIRTAVISNLLWSGDALTKRLNRLLPNNKFEFVMTSSDYFICKPNRILFDIALQKAELSAEDVWYCGDNPQNDVEGAAKVGIYPIWYDNSIDKDYIDRANEKHPQCDHLYIKEWHEMIDVLQKLKTRSKNDYTTEYLNNPCGTLSIPYWKAKNIVIPPEMKILHDKDFSVDILSEYTDEKYFRLYHNLKEIPRVATNDFEITTATQKDIKSIVQIINDSYTDISVNKELIKSYTKTPVYNADLWVMVKEKATNKYVGCGMADFDIETKELILEWIQVLPQYRGKKIGQLIVTELLFRMKDVANFATVSGKVDNTTNPEALYRKCGFVGNDVWHILHKR